MKILWITNILFPEAEQKLTGESVLKGSGGWILGSAKALIQHGGIELAVATVTKRVKQLTVIQGEQIIYYCLPYGKGNLRENHEYEPLWREVYERFKPDVTHIHGTEFSHGLAFVEACGPEKCVISIQGLTSAIFYYYYYGLTKCQILTNITFGDVVRGGGILHDASIMKRRGEFEKKLICKAHHIIGRTSWDKSHIWAINPSVKYHFCNETLREEFYSDQWDYNTCEPQSIFLSQANNPIKGLHQVLKSLPLIKREYPNVKVRIAGRDITSHDNSLRGFYAYSGYGKLVKKMIKQLDLVDNISFLGPLSGEEMKKEYLRANVFVCPSTIENSPNSIGEAQLLGTPCVASNVGGVLDLIPTVDYGYTYRFEEIEMLAWNVCRVFGQKDTINNCKMRDLARSRHDAIVNASILIDIYNQIAIH